MKTLIIAEAGVNHNGDIKLAFKLVDAAVAAGADVVKFQTFKAELLSTEKAEQADYQRNNAEEKSQLTMLKKLELTYEEHQLVKAYCDQKDIAYLSTAFDMDSLDFLVEKLSLTILKLPSGEITNAPFILKHSLTGCDLIVSTGMANLDEIEFALGVIAYGLIKVHEGNIDESLPSKEDFFNAYQSDLGQKLLKEKVTLLHCTTEYPAPVEEVNLAAMELMAEKFSLPIGYSDHTAGIAISLAATARKACIIEKHFTLDRTMKGPDHQASIEPDELTLLVKSIRDINLAIGQPVKKAMRSEIKNMSVARKSIFAKRPLKKGQLIAEEDLVVMRPGTGLSAKDYFEVVGSLAVKDFVVGETIVLS